jgi:hypothetical protein
MKKIIISELIIFVSLLLITQCSLAQTNQDTLKSVNTVGIFDGKKVTVGNFEVEEVYKINEYCIALADITEGQVASLKGKKVLVTGKLKIITGETHSAKTSTDGKIYEPYKEPDKKFITGPKFTIVYNSREPLLQSE